MRITEETRMTEETRKAFWAYVTDKAGEYTPQEDTVFMDDLVAWGLDIGDLALDWEDKYSINLLAEDYEEWETVGRWVAEVTRLREGK